LKTVLPPLCASDISIIDRETYGWMEFIENKKCQKESELEEYYYKIGVII